MLALLILLIAGISLAAGYFISIGAFFYLFLLFGASIALIILVKPTWGFSFLLFSLFLPIGFVQRYVFWVPTYIKWVPFFLLALVTMSYFFRRQKVYKKDHVFLLPKGVIVTFLLILAVGVVSIVYNQVDVLVALVGLRHWFFLIASILLLSWAAPTLAHRERIVKFFCYVSLLQILVTIVQRILFYSINPDMVTGLFGSYADLLFFQAFCLVALTLWWLKKKPLIKLPFEIFAAGLVVTMVLSNAKFAWLYLPVMVLFAIRTKIFFIKKRSIYFLMIFSLLIVVGAWSYDYYYKERNRGLSAIEIITNPANFIEYNFATSHSDRLASEEEMRRGEAVVSNFLLIYQDPVTMLIGLGPGNFSDSRVQAGSYYLSNLSARAGSDTTQLSILVGEMGVIGVALTIILFAQLFFLSRQYKGDLPSKNCFFELTQTCVFGVAIMIGYYPVLGSLIALICLACCIAPIRQIQLPR